MPASLSAPPAAHPAAPIPGKAERPHRTHHPVDPPARRPGSPAGEPAKTEGGITTREFLAEAGWAAATFTGIAVVGLFKAVQDRRNRPAPPATLNKEQEAFLKRAPTAAWKDEQSRTDSASGLRRLSVKYEGHTVTIQMFAKAGIGIVYQIISKGPVHRFGFEITSAADSPHLEFARGYIEAVIKQRPIANQPK